MPKAAVNTVSFLLRVTDPFDVYQRGDEITDDKNIQKILDSELHHNVVKVNLPSNQE